MIRIEQKIQERAERIEKLIHEAGSKLNEFTTMLNYHGMTLSQFESTGKALKLGTGELELF